MRIHHTENLNSVEVRKRLTVAFRSHQLSNWENKMKRKLKAEPVLITREQLDAVRQFAKENGRNWKEELAIAWSTSSAKVNGQHSPELQQIRNNFGPDWLKQFRLEEP